jgi:hypothetical protein
MFYIIDHLHSFLFFSFLLVLLPGIVFYPPPLIQLICIHCMVYPHGVKGVMNVEMSAYRVNYVVRIGQNTGNSTPEH